MLIDLVSQKAPPAAAALPPHAWAHMHYFCEEPPARAGGSVGAGGLDDCFVQEEYLGVLLRWAKFYLLPNGPGQVRQFTQSTKAGLHGIVPCC